MNSRDFLVINGNKNSNDESIGLYIDTPPMYSMAEQKTTVINIPDREESLYITHNEFEDVTMRITGYTFTNDFNISRVYEWLRTAKTFWFNSNPKYYFRVKKLLGITPKYQGHGKNIIDISFIVSPFRYFADEAVTSYTAKTFQVNNQGNYYSRPLYTVYGNGDITISTVDASDKPIESLKIFGVSGNCTIDSERLIISKDGAFLRTEGVIPILNPGQNKIKITGNTTSVTVRMNQRDV